MLPNFGDNREELLLFLSLLENKNVISLIRYYEVELMAHLSLKSFFLIRLAQCIPGYSVPSRTLPRRSVKSALVASAMKGSVVRSIRCLGAHLLNAMVTSATLGDAVTRGTHGHRCHAASEIPAGERAAGGIWHSLWS